MSRPLRVLCVLPDLDRGGAARTMVNLVNAFPGCGVEPRLVVFRGNGVARSWLDEPKRLLDLGLAHTRAAILPLRSALRAWGPDLVFSTMVDANIVAAFAAAGLRPRPIMVLRETNSHRARGDLGLLRRRAVAWAYRRADRLVALSGGVGRELVADYGLEPSRVVTVHNPVDVDGFRARAAASGPPSWSDWASGGPVLVGVGRLTRQKGYDVLVDAMARLERRDARLVLLAEGPDRQALEARVAARGLRDRVRMPGFVEDPAPWLAHAAAFVLPSRWEGFGHVIVEAMACGAPVIATDCPYGPADIIRPGRTGLLVPPADPSALAAAIDGLLASPDVGRALAAAALADISRFSIGHIAGQYAGLFRELVPSH